MVTEISTPARTAAAQPSVFLFDEPPSTLDARLRPGTRTFLKALAPMTLLEGKTSDESVLVADTAFALPDRAAGRLAAGTQVVLGARPEYFQFSSSPLAGAFPGVVEPLAPRCGDGIRTDLADGPVLDRSRRSRTLVRSDRTAFPASREGIGRLETWRNKAVAPCR